jgi:hypothetical protein
MNIVLFINSARQKHRAEAERGNDTDYRYDDHHRAGAFLVIQKSNDRNDGRD